MGISRIFPQIILYIFKNMCKDRIIECMNEIEIKGVKDEFRDDFKNVGKKGKGEKIFSDMHSKLIQFLTIN